MKGSTKAYLAEEGGKLVSDVIRMVMTRPRKPSPLESHIQSPTTVTQTESPTEVTVTTPIPHEPSLTPAPTRTPEEELDYRWECCMKHLGGASVLLREAYERAIDEGMGEGTAEKIMEAMNEHAGMEADLEKMLPIPEAKEQAEKLLSGVRAFRKAAWESRLTTGGGTKEDVADAKLWNELLYNEAFTSAKAQPGQECVREGM